MNYLLDIVGSTIIGGFVILMMIQFNANVNDRMIDRFYHMSTSFNAHTAVQVMDYDLSKIGYRDSSSNTITIANDKEFSFLADLDNNGGTDSVSYFMGNTNQLIKTANPDDKPIFRKLDTNSPELISIVTQLRFAYINETGVEFTPSTKAQRNLIKAVRIYVRLESPEPFITETDTIYRSQEFIRTFHLRN